jgi:phospholipase/carboxylesterase
MRDSLVILLHGVGASGAALAPLRDRLSRHLPETRFAAPDGPQAFDLGAAGRQWFSVSGVTPENRGERIVAARAGLDAALAEVIRVHGLEGREDRVALVGFSQGAILALDVVASGRWSFGAVVGFAARLGSPPPWRPASTPVLLVHGDADPVIPLWEGEAAATALRQAGVRVDWTRRAGEGHGVSAAGATAAGAFLARSLGLD